MDGTSPGNTWIGFPPGTGWNNSVTIICSACGGHNGHHAWCNVPPTAACAPNPVFTQYAVTTTGWSPTTARSLSDADVDRIARRIVELLRETKP